MLLGMPVQAASDAGKVLMQVADFLRDMEVLPALSCALLQAILGDPDSILKPPTDAEKARACQVLPHDALAPCLLLHRQCFSMLPHWYWLHMSR